MKKYRKKPVVIEAVQWDGTDAMAFDIIEWASVHGETIELMDAPSRYGFSALNHLNIRTLEGTMAANKDDWIIRGVQGEFYPCKPDIFEQTYEEAE